MVYRALDFLVANGLAHRIERLAAFAACTHGGTAHNAGFLICRGCRRVAETPLPRPARALAAEAAAAGFAIERTVMEAEGLCAPLPRGRRVTPLIEARGLGAAFGGQRVLRDVDLALHAGEIVTVVGPNGSGKSTLLRLLIGAARPDAGRIIRAPGLRIGYVPQKLAVDGTLPMTRRPLPRRSPAATPAAARRRWSGWGSPISAGGSSRRSPAASSSARCWRRRCCAARASWCSTRRRRGWTSRARRASTG